MLRSTAGPLTSGLMIPGIGSRTLWLCACCICFALWGPVDASSTSAASLVQQAGTCENRTAVTTNATCMAGSYPHDVLKPGSCPPKWNFAAYANWKLNVTASEGDLITLSFQCTNGAKECSPIPAPYDKQAVFYKVIFYVRPCFFQDLNITRPQEAGERNIGGQRLNPFNVKTKTAKNDYTTQLYWNQDDLGQYWTINMYKRGHKANPFKQNEVIYMRRSLALKYLVHDCTGQLKYTYLDPIAHTWCPAANLAI